VGNCEISVLTHRENQFHTIKLKEHNKSSKNTQTENTIKTKGLGLV